jgi:hypothetical protein
MGASASHVVLALLQMRFHSQIASCVLLAAGKRMLDKIRVTNALLDGTEVQQIKDVRSANLGFSLTPREVKIAPAVQQDHGLKKPLPANASGAHRH